MRDQPRSPRQASPLPHAPRTLCDELGDFMSSSNDEDEDEDEYEYDDNEYDDEDDYEDESNDETPMSSRKSSQSDDDQHDLVFKLLPPPPQPPQPPQPRRRVTLSGPRVAFQNVRDGDDECPTRPATATAASHPPLRRSSTLPVLTPDFLFGAAEEVVKIMPEQADFMKRMVEGWREIQRRSSVSVENPSPVSPGSTSTEGPPQKRPHTAPSPMYPPTMNFASFPQTVQERDEEMLLGQLDEVDEEPRSREGSVASYEAMVERLGEVEETLDELKDLAKQQAEAAIASYSTSPAEQDAKFAVVNKCIDTIGRVCEKRPEAERGRRRRRLRMKGVNALVQICEMFASEAPDGGAYRFESGYRYRCESEEEDDESEIDVEDYADDEAEAEDEEESRRSGAVARAWCRAQQEFNLADIDPTAVESGDFLGDPPTIETDKTLPPPPPLSPTKDPFDDRRHAELVEQAKEELDTLLSEAAESEMPYEERHSRVVYAVEAYLSRLSEMESTHDREFKWHAELKAFHVAMGSRRILSPEPGTAMALVASLSFCFIPIATVLWYVTEPTTTWMLWRIFIPIGCYFLLLGGFYIDQKHAREALYEEMLPAEARDMRRRHKREKELLQAAHDRAVQRVYSPET